MRRYLIGFLVLGLMAGSVATAEAKKRPAKRQARQEAKQNQKTKQEGKQEAKQGASEPRVERTVEESYGPYPAPVTGCNSVLGPYACLIIPTDSREAFFTAKVSDAHGLPVFVEVRGGGLNARFCGETKKPIRFRPGAELYFNVALPYWGIQTHCPAHSIKTTGTISVTLSNLPPAQPVRSGTILSGDTAFLESEVGACQMATDCRAWLESGCDPALANRNPALMASIVDVGDLADGRTPRVFEYTVAKPAGLRWGGNVIQFWRQDCTQIRGRLWHPWEQRRYGDTFIPVSAEWMTVSSTPDNAHIVWTLT